VLVWIGSQAYAPSCPDAIPAQLQYGIDLVAPPLSCGTCACDPPVGSCTLPEILSTSSAICPGTAAGASHIFFNAPPGWDGSCSAMDAIPACGGGPCVESLTISPLNVTQGVCTPVAVSPPAPPIQPVWSTVAVSCKSMIPPPSCENPGEICAPSAPPDFLRCISFADDLVCPGEPYTEKHLVYQDKDILDQRTCTPCSCGAPEGNSCKAMISVFSDQTCSDLVGTNSISSLGPTCIDIQPPGQALGSKSAGPVTYTPGTCQPSGGKPTGSIKTKPVTFCCLPKP
jgi:hypothetical protein